MKIELALGKEEKLANSLIKIFIFLFAGCILVYWVNTPIVNSIYFSSLILLFFISKKKIFWLAFFFILFSSPFLFFYYQSESWIIQLTPTVGISYVPVISVAIFYKYFILKQRSIIIYNYFNKYYKIFGYYTILLVFLGIGLGSDIRSFFIFIQIFPAFLLFFVLPRLLTYDELRHFIKIIFYFLIIHNIISFIDIGLKGEIYNSITFNNGNAGFVIEEKGLIRSTGGIILSLFSMISGMYYLLIKDKYFKNWFLWIVIIVSLLYILASATRGWMIASMFLMSVFTFYILGSKVKVRQLFIGIIIGLVLFFIMPHSLYKNIELSFDRLSTLEALSEGDETAEGTLSRLTERGPKVLTRFNDSPIIGFGFSKISNEYIDEHVGNHSILLMGGVLGLLIVWLTFLSIFYYLFRLNMRGYSFGFKIIAFGLASIMIIHSTSRSMVGFYMSPDAAFMICLFFNLVNVSINKAKALQHG